MIFTLVDDFASVIGSMPRSVPRYRTLQLLFEAVRRDVHFVATQPTTLFQCLWNSCWWYDAPQADPHYVESPGLRTDTSETPLSTLLEKWRVKQLRPWLRSLRPPVVALGNAQVAVLTGHAEFVRAVTFAPDGSKLASVGGDGRIRIWDVATGAALLVAEAEEAHGRGITYAPDGRCWACIFTHRGGTRSVVCVSDALTGRVLVRLVGHDHSVECVAFTSDGQSVATGSFDQTIRLWDANTGNCKMVLHGHEQTVTSVAFSPDGRWLVSASFDRTLRLWDLGTGTVHRVFRGHEAAVNCVAFLPNG